MALTEGGNDMNRIIGIGIGIAGILSLIACSHSGIQFSQTDAVIDITTLSTATPDVLREVSATCPADGFLLADANTRLSYTVVNPSFAGTIAYSISRNDASFDPQFQQNLFGNFVNNFSTIPVSLQRVDPCTDGEVVTYSFLATKGTNSTDVTAHKPSLVVTFYEDLL
jgi:hypothetical protein